MENFVYMFDYICLHVMETKYEKDPKMNLNNILYIDQEYLTRVANM